ncbi:hypothetical protein DAEQUDRAFT_769277 [Daedalea quercina L-15889]|uniref:Uncharacterized protein n=1 Tax=Daedalea quercina L-15889 TaxID=1314783 RepID=A0A165LWP6_9APHY|nr:hypothetical protein DAEQUDRAFT_769277 [Daedalea quercina L-15889]
MGRARSYLQTGGCGDNGESSSSADISLISSYWNGFDDSGTDCTSADCNEALRNSDDTTVQVGCSEDNVNLAICD